MTFIVRTMTAPCEDKEVVSSLIIHLANSGYDPLIARAKQQFLSVFGKNVSMETILQELRPGSPVPTFELTMHGECLLSFTTPIKVY